MAERKTGGSYPEEPILILITDQAEIGQLAALTPPEQQEVSGAQEHVISAEAWARLQAVDYQTSFVLALFQGRKPSSGYQVTIERVARREGGELVVYARFDEPAPYTGVATAETSPYHVVQVRRDGQPVTGAALVLQAHVVTPSPRP